MWHVRIWYTCWYPDYSFICANEASVKHGFYFVLFFFGTHNFKVKTAPVIFSVLPTNSCAWRTSCSLYSYCVLCIYTVYCVFILCNVYLYCVLLYAQRHRAHFYLQNVLIYLFIACLCIQLKSSFDHPEHDYGVVCTLKAISRLNVSVKTEMM